jgi:hypothetical protein
LAKNAMACHVSPCPPIVRSLGERAGRWWQCARSATAGDDPRQGIRAKALESPSFI